MTVHKAWASAPSRACSAELDGGQPIPLNDETPVLARNTVLESEPGPCHVLLLRRVGASFCP